MSRPQLETNDLLFCNGHEIRKKLVLDGDDFDDAVNESFISSTNSPRSPAFLSSTHSKLSSGTVVVSPEHIADEAFDLAGNSFSGKSTLSVCNREGMYLEKKTHLTFHESRGVLNYDLSFEHQSCFSGLSAAKGKFTFRGVVESLTKLSNTYVLRVDKKLNKATSSHNGEVHWESCVNEDLFTVTFCNGKLVLQYVPTCDTKCLKSKAIGANSLCFSAFPSILQRSGSNV